MRFARFDRWGTPLPAIDKITRATWTTGVDGTRTLEITATGESDVAKGDRLVFTDPRGRFQETIVTSPEHTREDTAVTTSLVCKGSVSELDDTFITDRRNRKATARQCLAKALEGTRWSVGQVDGDTTADLSFYYISALEAVTKTAEKYGLEITTSILMNPQHTAITHRAVNLLAAQGNQEAAPQRFEYGHGLKASPAPSTPPASRHASTGTARDWKRPTATAKPPAATGGASTSPPSTAANPTWRTPPRPNDGASPARPSTSGARTSPDTATWNDVPPDGMWPVLATVDAFIKTDGGVKPHTGNIMLKMDPKGGSWATRANHDYTTIERGSDYEISYWAYAPTAATLTVKAV